MLVWLLILIDLLKLGYFCSLRVLIFPDGRSLNAACVRSSCRLGIFHSSCKVTSFIFLPLILIYFYSVISIAVPPVPSINDSCTNSRSEMSNKKGAEGREGRGAVQRCHFNSLCCNRLHFRSTVSHLYLFFFFLSPHRSVCPEQGNIIHSSVQLSQGRLSSPFSKSVLQHNRKALGIQFLNAFVTLHY